MKLLFLIARCDGNISSYLSNVGPGPADMHKVPCLTMYILVSELGVWVYLQLLIDH